MKLVVCEVPVTMNKQGLYSLNDFHKAAGGEPKNRPGYWLDTDTTKKMVSLLESSAGKPALKIIKGGRTPGTFACKELVYSYAMWISPEFQLHVIKVFDEWLHTEYQRKAIRENARDGYKDLTLALKYSLESIGKTPKFYHYSNEADMINIIALGMTAKQFREEHNLDDSDQLRDYQTPFQIFAVEQLQRMDEQLINIGFTVEQRRNALQKRFDELSMRVVGLSG